MEVSGFQFRPWMSSPASVLQRPQGRAAARINAGQASEPTPWLWSRAGLIAGLAHAQTHLLHHLEQLAELAGLSLEVIVGLGHLLFKQL